LVGWLVVGYRDFADLCRMLIGRGFEGGLRGCIFGGGGWRRGFGGWGGIMVMGDGGLVGGGRWWWWVMGEGGKQRNGVGRGGGDVD